MDRKDSLIYSLKVGLGSKITVNQKDFNLVKTSQIEDSSSLICQHPDYDQKFQSLCDILKDRPSFNEKIVYKLLELRIKDQNVINLIANSYQIKLSPELISKIFKVLNE